LSKESRTKAEQKQNKTKKRKEKKRKEKKRKEKPGKIGINLTIELKLSFIIFKFPWDSLAIRIKPGSTIMGLSWLTNPSGKREEDSG